MVVAMYDVIVTAYHMSNTIGNKMRQLKHDVMA